MTTHSLFRALPISLLLASALTACGDVDHPPPVGQGGDGAPQTPPVVSLAGRSSAGGSETSGSGGDSPDTSFGGTNTAGDSSFGSPAGSTSFAGSDSFAGSSSFGATSSFGGTDTGIAGSSGL